MTAAASGRRNVDFVRWETVKPSAVGDSTLAIAGERRRSAAGGAAAGGSAETRRVKKEEESSQESSQSKRPDRPGTGLEKEDRRFFALFFPLLLCTSPLQETLIDPEQNQARPYKLELYSLCTIYLVGACWLVGSLTDLLMQVVNCD